MARATRERSIVVPLDTASSWVKVLIAKEDPSSKDLERAMALSTLIVTQMPTDPEAQALNREVIKKTLDRLAAVEKHVADVRKREPWSWVLGVVGALGTLVTLIKLFIP